MRSILLLLGLVTFGSFSKGQDSLVLDTPRKISEFRSTRLPAYTVPVLLISYGFAAVEHDMFETADRQIRHEILEKYPNFSTTLEDKLQHAPVIMVYSLDVLGVKSKHNFIDRTGIYLIANTLTSISVDFMKDKTHRLRPSAADHRSFPSGHTANAFLAAEFMRQEYGQTSPWYAYAGYTVAFATGALRIMNNDHWFSDVAAGAGIGILSAKMSYVIYPWMKKRIFKGKEPAFLLLPRVRSQNLGYVLVVPL